MARIEVFGEAKEKEPVVRLQLIQDGDSVTLRTVDAEGNRIKDIFFFHPDGTFSRFEWAQSPGLKTDGTGRIVERP